MLGKGRIPINSEPVDLDLDGDLDALSASFRDNKIAWYENTDGEGAFGPAQRISSNDIRGARSVSVADLDGDTDLEIIVPVDPTDSETGDTPENQVWVNVYHHDGNPIEGWPKYVGNEYRPQLQCPPLVTDLDGDGIDELYVANDDDGEINRYVWKDGSPVREHLYSHPEGLSGFTWNIMPAPISLIPSE